MGEFDFKKYQNIEFKLEMLAYAFVAVCAIYYYVNRDEAIEDAKTPTEATSNPSNDSSDQSKTPSIEAQSHPTP